MRRGSKARPRPRRGHVYADRWCDRVALWENAPRWYHAPQATATSGKQSRRSLPGACCDPRNVEREQRAIADDDRTVDRDVTHIAALRGVRDLRPRVRRRQRVERRDVDGDHVAALAGLERADLIGEAERRGAATRGD